MSESKKASGFKIRQSQPTKKKTADLTSNSPREEANKSTPDRSYSELSYPFASQFENYRCVYCMKSITEPKRPMMHSNAISIKQEIIKYTRESTFYRANTYKKPTRQKIPLHDRMYLANLLRNDLHKFLNKVKIKIGDLHRTDYSQVENNMSCNPNILIERNDKILKADKMIKESFTKLKIFEEVIIPFNEREKCEICGQHERGFESNEHFPINPSEGYIITKDYYTIMDKMQKEKDKKNGKKVIAKENNKKISFKFMLGEFVLYFAIAITNLYSFKRIINKNYAGYQYLITIYQDVISKAGWKNKQFLKQQINLRRMKAQHQFDHGSVVKAEKYIKESVNWYLITQGLLENVYDDDKNVEKKEESVLSIFCMSLYYYLNMLHYNDCIDQAIEINMLLSFVVDHTKFRSLLFHGMKMSCVRFKEIYARSIIQESEFFRIMELMIEKKHLQLFGLSNTTKKLEPIQEMIFEKAYKNYDFSEQIEKNNAQKEIKARTSVNDQFIQFYRSNKNTSEPYDPQKEITRKIDKKNQKRQNSLSNIEKKFNKIMGDDKKSSMIFSENQRRSTQGSRISETKVKNIVVYSPEKEPTPLESNKMAQKNLQTIEEDNNYPILIKSKLDLQSDDPPANKDIGISDENLRQQIEHKSLKINTDIPIENGSDTILNSNDINQSDTINCENFVIQPIDFKKNFQSERSMEKTEQMAESSNISQNFLTSENTKRKTVEGKFTPDHKSDMKTNSKYKSTLDSQREINQFIDSNELRDSKKTDAVDNQCFLSQPSSVKNQTAVYDHQTGQNFDFSKNEAFGHKRSISTMPSKGNNITQLGQSKSTAFIKMDILKNDSKNKTFQIKKGVSFNRSEKFRKNVTSCDMSRNRHKNLFMTQTTQSEKIPETLIDNNFKTRILKAMNLKEGEPIIENQAIKWFTENCLSHQENDQDGCVGYDEKMQNCKDILHQDFPDKSTYKFFKEAAHNKIREYEARKTSVHFQHTLDKEKQKLADAGRFGESSGQINYRLLVAQAYKNREEYEKKLNEMERSMPHRLQNIMLKNKDHFSLKKILWTLGVKVVTQAPDNLKYDHLLPDKKQYKVITTDLGQKLSGILGSKVPAKTKKEKDFRFQKALSGSKVKGDKFECCVKELAKRKKEEKQKEVKPIDPEVFERTKNTITNNMLRLIDTNEELDVEHEVVYEEVALHPKRKEVNEIEFYGDVKLIQQFQSLKSSLTDRGYSTKPTSNYKKITDLNDSKDVSETHASRSQVNME